LVPVPQAVGAAQVSPPGLNGEAMSTGFMSTVKIEFGLHQLVSAVAAP
jgi:hypothetical protein